MENLKEKETVATFMTYKEEKAKELFSSSGFQVINMWITGDVREGRGDELWLNIVCEK